MFCTNCAKHAGATVSRPFILLKCTRNFFCVCVSPMCLSTSGNYFYYSGGYDERDPGGFKGEETKLLDF